MRAAGPEVESQCTDEGCDLPLRQLSSWQNGIPFWEVSGEGKER